jgi:hypothetical protein
MTSKFTKWQQNLPNGSKIYQMTSKFTKWPINVPYGRKIFQLNIIYIRIFHSKDLQNIPKSVFLVLKYLPSGNPALRRSGNGRQKKGNRH